MVSITRCLSALEKFDTPTICNALEMIEDTRRGYGYTSNNMVAINEGSGPVAGIAMTASMRSAYPSDVDEGRLKQERLRYYEYMYTDVGGPKVCVMQDLDGAQAGKGPFWGEFNTRIHRAMGFRAIVTDGSVRDLSKLPKDILILARGLRPSHAYVHITSFGQQVNVYGMAVSHGDVIHADAHGAVAFPQELLEQVQSKAHQFIAAEAPIIEACKNQTLTLDELRRLYLSRSKR
jgi:regulator of RNase E activity RraA